MRLFLSIGVFLALFEYSLQSVEYSTHQPKETQIIPKTEPLPWLTGPLLTPSGHVIPHGHFNIEPYQFATVHHGLYDKDWKAHSLPNNFYVVSTQVSFQYGFAKRFDFLLNPSFSWNHINGASHWTLNDFSFEIDYQLLYDRKGKWWPAIKLTGFMTFPIGKYQKLDPKSKKTDIGGAGTWSPGLSLNMSQLYWWGGHIFFAPRLSFGYAFPTPVHVKGYNTYGGGHHTNGKVYPGQVFIGLFGFEISLSQRWAIAGDVEYLHSNKTRFSGHKGKTNGVPNTIGYPSIDQWGIAPAIEYNWSAYVGMIAGVWFSVAGRNAPEFASAIVAMNIYH